MGLQSQGKVIIRFGLVLVALGACLAFGGKPSSLGKSPGDLIIHRGHTTICLPLATSAGLSLVAPAVRRVFCC